jgi:hypothetical protein
LWFDGACKRKSVALQFIVVEIIRITDTCCIMGALRCTYSHLLRASGEWDKAAPVAIKLHSYGLDGTHKFYCYM